MNVLFVVHNAIDSNSGIHVHHFANRLAELGADCAVATPKRPVDPPGQAKYGLTGFAGWRTIPDLFADGRPPDVVHAWTPRELVRTFCMKLGEAWRFATVVHLEDNEEYLLERTVGTAVFQLAAQDQRDVPIGYSHPVRAREFMASSRGVTVIVDPLADFVPDGVPTLLLQPGADTDRFFPRARDEQLAARLGVRAGVSVIGYTGNVHAANAREVCSVYVAAALLTREGAPTVVLRAGTDHCAFLGEDPSWAAGLSVELGQLRNEVMPEVLAIPDLLVQPGRPDRFNDYRLPSKLPEYLAMGRPVVLPLSNLGHRLVDQEEALVYPVVDALAIGDAVRKVVGDPQLRDRLGQGAFRFAQTQLSWERSASRLLGFYEQAVQRVPASEGS